MATVNKQAIAAAFGRAAALYEQHADLQRQSADVLLAMLSQRKYTHVLDAGCGPGWMSRHWRERHAQVTALDLSPPMLVQARQKDAADHYLAGDIESLPLATNDRKGTGEKQRKPQESGRRTGNLRQNSVQKD